MSADPPPLPDLTEVLGLPLDDARLAEVAAAFREVSVAIEALRAFELGETHPAVIFRPFGEHK